MKKANWLTGMPNYRIPQPLSVLLLLALATVLIFARSRSSSSAHNLLLINGESIEYARFSIYSTGVLALVANNPETNDALRVPFRIYIRRGNLPVNSGRCRPVRTYIRRGNLAISNGRCNPCQPVYEMEVSRVLATAKAGDFLVIEPVRSENVGVTHVIRLTDYLQPIIRLFPTPKGDGC